MHTKRVLLSLILVAIGVALTVLATASTTQAAPESTAASFGMLMKPGWGGTGDAQGINAGSVYLLRCAYMKGRLPRLSSAVPLTQTQVITTWGFVNQNGYGLNLNCAVYTGPNLGGVPVPNGYVPPH